MTTENNGSTGPVKRKRGRPRTEEPHEINNFDLTVIQEFRKRRAFYDHEHPDFKNRPELDRLWIEMSRTIGYSVQLIKARVLQLRNRYNLEKRRVESLRLEYDDPSYNTSHWHLYDKLSFLGEHIRTRRSYTQRTVHPKQAPPSSSSNSDQDDEDNEPLNAIARPPQLQHHTMITRRSYQTQGNNGSRHGHSSLSRGQQFLNGITAATAGEGGGGRENAVTGCEVSSAEKFKAFGQFLASSLMELHEKDALRLVEKFTSDLVRCLVAEARPYDDGTNSTMDVSI